MFRIKSKIIIASTLVFALMLIGFAYLVYRSSGQAELLKEDARLESQADKLQTEIEEQCQGKQFPNMEDLLKIKTEGLGNVRMQLYDTSGHLVISDSVLASAPENIWHDSVLRTSYTQNLTFGRQRYRCHWSPVEIDNRTEYVLLLASTLHEVHENLEYLRTIFFITIPLALLITALATYFITRKAFRPVTDMIETAQKISATNLQQRLRVPQSKDEVRMLAETLNEMIERIDSAFKSQRQFIADASHEIRTPLTIINSELELAYKRAADDSIKESIQISLSEVDRLAQMANDLLLLARLDSIQTPLVHEAIRLDEILVESVKIMNSLAVNKHISLDLHIDEAVELSGDKDKLKRVIMNIIDNAIKYSNENTRVEITLRVTDGRAIISVIDEGIGISESDMPNVFKRFYQAEGPRSGGEGSGLGLAIARKLIELHGGVISINSQIGRGTTVKIELPLR